MFDVIVIGGSFAGLTSAVFLGRARKNVLVFDAGEPRNRFSTHSHGVLALEGKAGSEILAETRQQLKQYETVKLISKRAVQISKKDGFVVVDDSGFQHHSKKIILAHGLNDDLPDIPGIRERWGKTVLHCPYCHGYEIGGGPIAVIATQEGSTHQAILAADWGEVTFFTNEILSLDAEMQRAFQKRGVRVCDGKVEKLSEAEAGRIRVHLKDGSESAFKAGFIAPAFSSSSPFAQELGCEFEDTPVGRFVKTDEWKKTSIDGVYAAGDLTRARPSIPLATADGMLAAVGAHQSLIADQLAEK